LLLVATLAIGLRLAYQAAFPTAPFSDFGALVQWARLMRDQGLSVNSWHWVYFNPGLPLILRGLLGLAPAADPASLARLATGLATGLMAPMVTLLLGEGLSWSRRMAVGLALAVWPGQVMFSGVVAQDNWLLLPLGALAALAIRSLLTPTEGQPMAAGLIFVAAVALRQESLLVALPLLVAASGLWPRNGRVLVSGWRRRLAVTALATCLPLSALAGFRWAATGCLTLASEHAGLSILGSYAPGAARNGYWTDPVPWVAATGPELLTHSSRLRGKALCLAVAEARRRPLFHAARATAATSAALTTGDADNLYWALLAPGALPEPRAPAGRAMVAMARTPLRVAEMAIFALVAAASLLSAWRRDWLALPLLAALALKLGVHAITTMQGRFVGSLELLGLLLVVMASRHLQGREWPRATACVALGTLAAVAVAAVSPRLEAAVRARDDELERQYLFRFALEAPDRSPAAKCEIATGRLTALDLDNDVAQLAFLARDPQPGDLAVARCRLSRLRATHRGVLRLEIEDPYPIGDLPGRVEQRVILDGVEVARRDIAAEAGGGWWQVPLSGLAPAARHDLEVQLIAIGPDPGAAWGPASASSFRFRRAPES
jgi:hypothetical protein